MSSDNNILIPDYLSIDYSTLKSKLQNEIRANNVFRDTNWEGSNITVLIELISYISELQTFLVNKMAKNLYFDTADIYENVHRISKLIGYDPSGYDSSRTTLTLTLSGGWSPGDQIYIPAWSTFNTSEDITYDSKRIDFATVKSYLETIPLSASTSLPYTIDISVVQGVPQQLSYSGDDLIDNEIILPFYNYAHNQSFDDETNPIQVYVNDVVWTRINDFYDDITETSEIVTDQVFKLEYDKYGRYKVVFSSLRELPVSTSTIDIYLLKSLGLNGSVGANTITEIRSDTTITNVTSSTAMNHSLITVTNSTATTGAAEIETIDDIKSNAKGFLRSQYRNVTKVDYISHLEQRSDVTVANVWGEQDIAPSGSIAEYNKVYVSTIPDTWTANIATSAQTVYNEETPSLSANVSIPISYYNAYKTKLRNHLEPRKMLTTYEQFQVPDIVYFYFDIGIRVRRAYSYNDVYQDVRNKLIYYFRTSNHDFNSTIHWLDIKNYLLDTSYVSTSNSFTNIVGVENLIFRDVDIANKTIYEPNNSGNYPQYTVSQYIGDNKLRPILLGNNQFPYLVIDITTFDEET